VAHEDSLIDLRLPEPARLFCGEEHLHTQEDQHSISEHSDLIRIQLGQRIRIGNKGPDPGRPKLSHKKRIKGRNFKFEEEQERPL
jgi:hypothetical protein